MTTDPKETRERIILFVAGKSPRSERARSNLARALAAAGLGAERASEIDLLAHPEATLEYDVYATPVLIGLTRDGTGPALYGDLSEETRLRRFLKDIFADTCEVT